MTSLSTEIVTNGGDDWMLQNAIASATLYIGWGTGAGPTKSSTGLTTPASEARVQATVTHTTGQVVISGSITSASSQTITELGIFTASTGGTMIAGGTLSQTVAVGGGITFTLTIPLN